MEDEATVAELKRRIAELEAEVARLRKEREAQERAADKAYWGMGWD